jgi:hypothetical protein
MAHPVEAPGKVRLDGAIRSFLHGLEESMKVKTELKCGWGIYARGYYVG